MWQNFFEKIVDVLGLFLTNQETEKFLTTLPNNSQFATIMKKYSSDNLQALQKQAELKDTLCKHEGKCSINCIRGLTRTFIVGYIVKFIIALLPSLLTGKLFKKPQLVRQFAGRDTLRFALFLSIFVSSYKGVNCFLRKIRNKEDNWNALIAGMVAGTSLAIDDKSRRLTIATYISTRVLEFSYVYLLRRKYVPSIPHGDALVMALASSQILFAYIREPKSLPRSYFQFLVTHGGAGKYGPLATSFLEDYGKLVTEDVDISKYKGILSKFPIPFEELKDCSPACKLDALTHPTTSSCVKGNSIFFLESIPRSLSLYVPLNIATTLIFKHKLLLQRPLEFLKRVVTSSARSSLFLSLYCTVAWTVPCVLRNIFGRNHVLMFLINGFCSGLCVLLEVKSRRLELAMYCAPRALESLWNCLVKWGYVKNIKNGEVIYFSLAMGALMSMYQNEPECLNSAFRNVLTRFFGVN